ncbi:MAG TPA: transposase family protein [Pirellulales bacterium]|nr:transposase family protein [Pirellulales bacterium]
MPKPHEHWHVDVSYLNIAGTFYFLCSVLDGCSRFIVHWEIREKMEESDVEIILQCAREAHPGATPRIITDNGPQFVAKDFQPRPTDLPLLQVRTIGERPGSLDDRHRSDPLRRGPRPVPAVEHPRADLAHTPEQRRGTRSFPSRSLYNATKVILSPTVTR